MNLQHVSAKFFVDGEMTIDPKRFIEVFHRWIQRRALEELLIDVADYRHVPNGPGVVLIGHEADYSMDQLGGRYGMRYQHKAPLEGTNSDRFTQALRAAAQACELLEAELASGETLRFSRTEFELLVNDRALAPNTPETFAACRPELAAWLQATLGHADFTFRHDDDPRHRFAVGVELAKPLKLATIAAAGV